MNRTSWAYSFALVMSLVVVVVLANRGIVQSVVETGDIRLETNSTEYATGDAITFHATLAFRDGEVADIIRASGPTSLK